MRQRLGEVERRRQILDAAVSVAAKVGVGQLTLRLVAQEAKVSHGLVIHHYGSKEALQSALLDWVILQLLDPVPPYDPDIPAAQQLLGALRSQLDHLAIHQVSIGILLEFRILARTNSELGQRIHDEMAAFHTRYVPYTRQLIHEHPERFAGTTEDDLALMVGYLVIGYEINQLATPRKPRQTQLLSALESLLHVPVRQLESALI